MIQGNYEQHVLNGKCPSTHGDLMCERNAGHLVSPPQEMHIAKTLHRRDGSETVEWV